jgi:alpha-ketoglutarate-dependent 2,4-dichlorophenoxyacetate dioxygenase
MKDTMASLAKPAEQQFATRKLHPTLGLEISGLDVSKALDTATIAALTELSAKYKLLVLKDHSLTAAELNAFASQFGDSNQVPPSMSRQNLERHERRHNVSRLGSMEEPGEPSQKPVGYSALTLNWHSDSSWRPVPTWLTFLAAFELPDEGGDTCFADMQAAYQALSEERKTFLDRKNMIHNWDTMCRYEPSAIPLGENCPPPATHPVVRTIEERKSLFLSGHTGYYVGNMSFDEGQALYDELLDHATSPDFVYQHEWTLGDLLIWDNHTTMHRLLPYDWSQRRVMYRAEVCGTQAPE